MTSVTFSIKRKEKKGVRKEGDEARTQEEFSDAQGNAAKNTTIMKCSGRARTENTR